MKDTAYRTTGMRTRGLSMRALGVAWLASALACGGSGNESGTARLEGYRSKSPLHKVQIDAQKAAEWEKRGAKVLGDYGAFKMVQVDDAMLDSLPSAQGAELRDDYDHVLLNAGMIDTASAQAQAQRGVKKMAASGKGFHLVQFEGPVRAEWLQEIEATGVKVVSYIPNNAYLLYGDGATLNSLQRHITATPAIRWDGEYLTDYKMDPTVQTSDSPTFIVQLIKDEQANGDTLALIEKLQKSKNNVSELLGYVNVVTDLDRKAIYEIIQRPDVLSVQPRPTPRKFDERQNLIISGRITGTQPNAEDYLAWLASKGFTKDQFNFGVDVSDSGVDNGTQTPNHYGLYAEGNITGTSRVVYNRLEGTPNQNSTISGCDGHGNLNTHIIGGYSVSKTAPFADAAGFRYGLGVAPWVKVGSSVVFDPGTFTTPNYPNLQSRAYRDGMRISSNSWGSRANTYTADSQTYDALVRDAQPASAAVPAVGNQEMFIAFAAGNQGSGSNTVGSPATAKNVFTVGASENVQAFGGADGCGTTDAEANSAYDIVAFSSRGPTSDGRKKPDIMAPGTHVSGGVAQAAGQRANPPEVPTGKALACFDASGVCGGVAPAFFFPAGQEWYSASSGTSHSTPAVAGGAALVRQYFLNNFVNAPSPAMTKAYLMNSTRYMNGVGANDSLYSNNQGMGLMDLGMAFDGTPRLLDDQTEASLFTATGQVRTFTGVVADSTKPFRVTVAWTDAPGTTTGSAWKNNVDLSVTVGTTVYKGNVFTGANSVTGGTADVSNNVESVFLPPGVEGSYTVTVTGTNINSDGVPNNASTLDQDFALVAYNSCATATPSPAGVSVTVAGDNKLAVAWTENGSASYNIYRATTAGGPYIRVGSAVTSPFVDASVSGGGTYYYVVRAVQCAESPKSNESSATATGVCTLPPTFAGLTSATDAAATTCSSTLSWSAAAPACGGTLSYAVYRSTTADFTPSSANRIATGVTGTSFSDNLNLANGTSYYYVVRATEVSSTATFEETNTVQKSVSPRGPPGPGAFFDDLDTNRPANASAYWIPTATTGSTTTQNIVSGCRFQSPTSAYRFGAAGTTACGGTYPLSVAQTLVLGGNGSVASGINGFLIPSDTANPQMTFSVWYDFESRYDGAWLVYSTQGASGPWTPVNDAVTSSAPYISAGGYDNTLTSNTAIRIWTGALTNTNGALKPVTVNLSSLTGQKVWFGFSFYSDVTGVREGFYVDDVRLPTVVQVPSACTTNVPPAGPAVSYRVTLPTIAQVGRPATFSVSALDTVGQVATGYTGTAALTSTDAAATLPSPVTFTAGVASGLSATFNTAGNQTVTATDTTVASITGSSSLLVTAATKLAFTTQPTNATAGSTLGTVRVTVQNDAGATVTTGSFNVTLSLGNNPSGGTLSGTKTVTTVSGVATFTGLSVDKVGTGYTLKATSPALTEATSSAFNITAATASRLAFVTQPTTTVAGSPITPAVTVAVTDAFGNRITTSTASITLALTTPAGATLSGTTTVAAVAGLATFSNLSVNRLGDYTLTATSGTFTAATSTSFSVTAGAPYRVLITQQPSNTAAGANITPAVKVSIYDRNGNLATQATNAVTLLLGTNPSGAILGGTTTVNAVAGVATFDSVSVSRAGANYTLVASASGLFQDTSVSFDVSEGPPSAARLAFKTGPASATAGATLAAVEVELRDAQGNVLRNVNALVTLSLGTSPAEGQLFGTASATAVNGVARFEGLSLRKAGSYTLVANAQGFQSATSAAFDVTPGSATRFALSFPASVTSGQEASLSATAYDAYGNVATSYTGPANVTSSDPAATLPASATFAAGVLADLKVTFNSSGLRTLTLTDAAQASLSGSVQTNVTPFAQPTVAVTSPAGGTEVSGTVSITATGVVASGTSLRQISILVDGVVVGSGTASPFTATWDASKALNGSTHTFTAIITDASGGVGNSAPVSVTVKSDNTGGNTGGGDGDGNGTGGGNCGCGATSGADASLYLGLFALARYVSVRRRQVKKAA